MKLSVISTMLAMPLGAFLQGCVNPYIHRADAYYNSKTGVVTVIWVKHGVVNPATGNLGFREGYHEFQEDNVCGDK